MENSNRDVIGKFRVYDYFFIRKRKQFYLFGNIIEGHIEINNYIFVKLNSMLSFSIKINDIEEIEFSSSNDKFVLLIINCEDDNDINLIDAFRIGNEIVEISLIGED